MADDRFPTLDERALAPSRDALHAYARVVGSWASACRKRRKHWWHLSLRPSLRGLTTGVIRGAVDFELELDMARSQLRIRTLAATVNEPLTGQPAPQLAMSISNTLSSAGVHERPAPDEDAPGHAAFPDYSPVQANMLHRAIGSVAAALENFRACIREETSPIQMWPHHFDLSMIWLPGGKVPGQDRADEEHADKQMNFGFVPGDSSIPESYFYVTAYPLPKAMPHIKLPAGTTWRSEGFSGAVLLYKDLVAMSDPAGYLGELWNALYLAGLEHLCKDGEEHTA